MAERAPRDKTVTISFRISEKALGALQEEASKQNTSLNNVANQIFVAFSDFDRYMNLFHMVKMSTPTLRTIINAATDEEIARAGKLAGANTPEAFILAKTGELSLLNATDYLRSASMYANLWDYSESENSGRTVITLAHDLGPKGSLFVSSFVESLFKALGKEAKISQLPDSITIEI